MDNSGWTEALNDIRSNLSPVNRSSPRTACLGVRCVVGLSVADEGKEYEQDVAQEVLSP